MKRAWAAGALFSLLVSPFGCEGEDHFNRDCVTDADCRVVTSCCDGCFAVHVTETLDSCSTECVADPCFTRFGTDVSELEAFCSEGLCAARVSEP